MKKTNLQQVYDALTGKGGEVITLDESLRLRALGLSLIHISEWMNVESPMTATDFFSLFSPSTLL